MFYWSMYRDLADVALWELGLISFRFGHIPLLLAWAMTGLVWVIVGAWTVKNFVLPPSPVNLAFLIAAVVISTRGDQTARNFVEKFLERTRLDPPVLHKLFVTAAEMRVGNWFTRHLGYGFVGIALATLVVLNTLVKPLGFDGAYLRVTGGDLGDRLLWVAFIELVGYSLTKLPGNGLWQAVAVSTTLVLALCERVPWVRRILRETKLFRDVTLAILAITALQLLLWFQQYACFPKFLYTILGHCPTP
jgi:hypothetical protein